MWSGISEYFLPVFFSFVLAEFIGQQVFRIVQYLKDLYNKINRMKSTCAIILNKDFDSPENISEIS